MGASLLTEKGLCVVKASSQDRSRWDLHSGIIARSVTGQGNSALQSCLVALLSHAFTNVAVFLTPLSHLLICIFQINLLTSSLLHPGSLSPATCGLLFYKQRGKTKLGRSG